MNTIGQRLVLPEGMYLDIVAYSERLNEERLQKYLSAFFALMISNQKLAIHISSTFDSWPEQVIIKPESAKVFRMTGKATSEAFEEFFETEQEFIKMMREDPEKMIKRIARILERMK